MFRSLSMALVTLFVTPNLTAAAVTAWTDVTVRVYDGAGLDVKSRQSALDAAAASLASASVEVKWRVCSIGGTPTSHCETRPAPGELAIRIVRLPKTADRPGTLRLG